MDGYLARQALLRERDRMRVLFEITNALVSKLPMDELFSAISEQLSRVVAHDFAVVTLLDKATGEIHLKGCTCRAAWISSPTRLRAVRKVCLLARRWPRGNR